MGYTNCLMIGQMKELQLFDDIEYQYIKHIINNDDSDIEVEIEDVDCVECDMIKTCKTRFKFNIDLQKATDCCGGNGILRVDLVKEYDSSSIFAFIMMNLYEEED